MSPPVFDYLHYIWRVLDGFRSTHELWIARIRENDLSEFNWKSRSGRMLDLANGRLRPQYRILRAQGFWVCGIDIANYPKNHWQDYAYKIARYLDSRYLSASVPVVSDVLICGDVSCLPFRDHAFDIITSVAAFEHFLEVPKVIKEMHRVTSPGGLVWVLVHLFSSPSGGHNVSLSQVPLTRVPYGIEPWDHIRKRRLLFHVPLNEWRRDQYLTEFSRYFEVLKHYCAMREGESFLTPEIESELSDYSRDELTCGSYVIVARKPL